jgi:hypothetical protein
MERLKLQMVQRLALQLHGSASHMKLLLLLLPLPLLHME